MSGADLFSAGFAWDDVAPVATPVATPPAPAVSHEDATPSATPSAPSFSGDFAWNEPAVASVANVAGAVQSPPLGGVVASVASVANWRDSIDLMAASAVPAGIDAATWRQLAIDARILLQNWGADFIRLGWTTLEVFGVNRNPRHRRLDVPGLLPLIHGRPVEAVDRDTAVIRADPLHTSTFQRRLVVPGGVPVWDWIGRANQ